MIQRYQKLKNFTQTPQPISHEEKRTTTAPVDTKKPPRGRFFCGDC